MNRTFLLSSIALAALAVAAPASASPISVSASIAGGSYLSEGSHSGTFDASSLLPAQFTINSASFSFVFADDVDGITSGAPISLGTTYGPYYLTGSGSNYYTLYETFERTVTAYSQISSYGQSEGVGVALEGVDMGSGATPESNASTSVTAYNGRSFDAQYGSPGGVYYYSCGNRTCSYQVYGNVESYYSNNYVNTTTNTVDWNGGFEVSGDLSGTSLLDQLLFTRQLDFDLLVSGDLTLIGGTLWLDVTEVPQNKVSEPGSLSLALASLVGWGAVGWRRRKR